MSKNRKIHISRCDDPFITWSDMEIDLDDDNEVFLDENLTKDDEDDTQISGFSTIF